MDEIDEAKTSPILPSISVTLLKPEDDLFDLKENQPPNLISNCNEQQPTFCFHPSANVFTPIPTSPAALRRKKSKERLNSPVIKRKSLTSSGSSLPMPEFSPSTQRRMLKASSSSEGLPHRSLTFPTNYPSSESSLPPVPPHAAFSIRQSCPDLSVYADRTQQCTLPVVSTANGLKYVCSDTVASLLGGVFQKKFVIIDCRFEFEYEGGHIANAINIKTTADLEQRFFMADDQFQDTILVFHCEFSSHRGPKLCRWLRQRDRELNVYPKLAYPEIYVLDGGYKRFYESYPHLCSPSDYVTMMDPRYAELRKRNMFSLRKDGKVKRSWSTGSIKCLDKFFGNKYTFGQKDHENDAMATGEADNEAVDMDPSYHFSQAFEGR
jgi:rhodanese-related sulfurtransferase